MLHTLPALALPLYLFVRPNSTICGLFNSYPDNSANVTPRPHRLTRAMVDYVEQRTCVDRSLIFASGFSNGGFMSYRLACEAADLVPFLRKF